MKISPTLRLYLSISDIFNLRKDSDEDGTVENIRKNVDFHGANAWTLVFAIFIASIGLNMNSPAVIIGAMLISPLMGPILGIGLALGINDEELLRKSFRNLSIAVFISVATSMIYFMLSPIHEAQSELLARTYPTFYDVLIAFFGGAAGIVSISRRERGASVAGVAIATALMPPLCTAGYALSIGNMKFLAGAFYLFLINSVFIALSTFVFVRYMKFQVVQFQERDDRIKIRRWIGLIVLAMIAPSLFFAWSLLQESRFKIKAERFLKQEIHGQNTFIINQDLKYSHDKSRIDVSIVGNPLSEDEVSALTLKLDLYGLSGTKLSVQQIKPEEASRNSTISPLEIELSQLREKSRLENQKNSLLSQVTQEARVLFPGVSQISTMGDQMLVIWDRKPQISNQKK